MDAHQETQTAARSPRSTWQTVREVADIRNVSLQAYEKMDERARVAAMKRKMSAARGRSSGPRPSSQGAGRFAWRVAARPVSKTVVVSDDGWETFTMAADRSDDA